VATVFWDHNGMFFCFVYFLDRRDTVSVEHYCSTQASCGRPFVAKGLDFCAKASLFCTITVGPRTCDWLRRYGWEVMAHTCYCPCLVPSDFHLFGSLKKYVAGKRFTTNADMKHAVTSLLKALDTVSYAFMSLWDKCLNAYVEV
jgi:hypothetical protein